MGPASTWIDTFGHTLSLNGAVPICNLGTMLRAGDAVGAGGLILRDDSTDPYGVEAVRASMGAIFTQRLVQARWDDFLAWLRAGPGELVATWLGKATKDYQAVRYAAPTFILAGNASQGLPEAYAAAAHVRVRLTLIGSGKRPVGD